MHKHPCLLAIQTYTGTCEKVKTMLKKTLIALYASKSFGLLVNKIVAAYQWECRTRLWWMMSMILLGYKYNWAMLVVEAKQLPRPLQTNQWYFRLPLALFCAWALYVAIKELLGIESVLSLLAICWMIPAFCTGLLRALFNPYNITFYGDGNKPRVTVSSSGRYKRS